MCTNVCVYIRLQISIATLGSKGTAFIATVRTCVVLDGAFGSLNPSAHARTNPDMPPHAPLAAFQLLWRLPALCVSDLICLPPDGADNSRFQIATRRAHFRKEMFRKCRQHCFMHRGSFGHETLVSRTLDWDRASLQSPLKNAIWPPSP